MYKLQSVEEIKKKKIQKEIDLPTACDVVTNNEM